MAAMVRQGVPRRCGRPPQGAAVAKMGRSQFLPRRRNTAALISARSVMVSIMIRSQPAARRSCQRSNHALRQNPWCPAGEAGCQADRCRLRPGGARAGDSGVKDLFDRGLSVKFERVGAKGIGGDNFAASGDVGGVDAGNGVWIGKADQLGEGARLKARRLQHGTHAAIEKQVAAAFKGCTQVIIRDTQGVQRAGCVGLGALDDGHGYPIMEGWSGAAAATIY